VTVSRRGGLPVYQQIADALREAIRSGELAGGQPLPSETELIRRYSVSRNSVRTAVGLLRIEGLVVTEQGRGSFVRARRPLRRLGSPGRRAQQGGDADQRLLAVEVIQPPDEVAKRLGLGSAELTLVRRLLLVHGGEPAQLVDRYFPLRVARLASVEQAERMADAALVEPRRMVEELTLRMPEVEEAARLGMRGGVPVARVLRTCYDASGRALEVTDFVLVGDRHILVYEVSAH